MVLSAADILITSDARLYMSPLHVAITMRQLLITIALVLCQSLCFAQQWVQYTDPDSTFQIDLPYRPVERIDTIATELGTILLHNYYVHNSDSIQSSNTDYIINVLHYPPGTLIPIQQERDSILSAMIEGVTTQLNGRLDYEADDTKTRGKRARISIAHKSEICRLVTFIAQDRLFTLQVVSPAELSLRADDAYFFDSLRILF